jgi:predicted NodU family carbamoyl transferase
VNIPVDGEGLWQVHIKLHNDTALHDERIVIIKGLSRAAAAATLSHRTAPQHIFAAHLGHDAAMTIVKQGKVLGVLELERLFKIRHFFPEQNVRGDMEFDSAICRAIAALHQMMLGEISSDQVYDVGVLVEGIIKNKDKRRILNQRQEARLSRCVHVMLWKYVAHHVAHATMAFYESPFSSALIMSYDGGGSDGYTRVFSSDRTAGIHHG